MITERVLSQTALRNLAHPVSVFLYIELSSGGNQHLFLPLANMMQPPALFFSTFLFFLPGHALIAQHISALHQALLDFAARQATFANWPFRNTTFNYMRAARQGGFC